MQDDLELLPEDEDPDESYWASWQDTDRLAERLRELTSDFHEAFSGSVALKRIRRNYRYYHNMFYPDSGQDDMEMVVLGEEGEAQAVGVNQFRSLIQSLLTLITQHRPAWDTKAVNTEPESIQTARLGNAILDYQMNYQRVDALIRRAVEHALVLNTGYVYTHWDPLKGPSLPPQSPFGGPETLQEEQPIGDVRYDTPSYRDVIYDLSATEWEDIQWVRIRLRANKWDLIALHGQDDDSREKIHHAASGDDDDESNARGTRQDEIEKNSDSVDLWHFYHLPSPACPRGRFISQVGDLVLEEGDYNEEFLPLDRIAAGEQLLSCVGYTVANDLQGPQEWYNGELSSILTAHNALSTPVIYGGPSGSSLKEEHLDSAGVVVIYADEEPKTLNLLNTPAEITKTAELLNAIMEQISGVNSVSRGQPEASLKSGTALALIDAKAQQSASFLQDQYYRALEGVGTKTLRLYAKHGGNHPRTLAVVGKFNRIHVDKFVGEEMKVIDRALVQSTNALAKTPAGRQEIVKGLAPWIKTPEEYINVLTSGQMESAYESEVSELALVREESAILVDGGMAQASPADHHVLHIREHHAILGSTKIRTNNQIAENTMAHIMEHIAHLMDPGTQLLQMTLGYQVPAPYVEIGMAQAAGGNTPQRPPGPSEGPPMEGSGNPEGRPEAQAPPARVPAATAL